MNPNPVSASAEASEPETAPEITFVVYNDDKVAEQVLSLLEGDGKVHSAYRVARGSHAVPENAVRIVYRKDQQRYAVIEGKQRPTVFVRSSSKGMTDSYKQAIRRIPEQVASWGEQSIMG